VRRGRSRYALTLVASLAAMLAWPLITSGSAQFLDSTFGYQLIRRGGGVQFSIWTYMPHVASVARPLLAAVLVLLALSPMSRAPVQDARQHAALAAALLIGAQLLLGYWFYSYLTWCYPLLIVAIIQAQSDHEAADTSAHGAASARYDQSRIPAPLAADSAPDSSACPPQQPAHPPIREGDPRTADGQRTELVHRRSPAACINPGASRNNRRTVRSYSERRR
jgi:hypothetical protein